MVIVLVVIGLLRFVAGTFFEYTNQVKIVDATLYVIAIIFMIVYLGATEQPKIPLPKRVFASFVE